MTSLKERFWAKVDKGDVDGCWLWTGTTKSKDPNRAYGTIWDGGKSRPAHRVAWELANGQMFPDGMDACHRCDNPCCVRPDHIFPGTKSDNARDCVAKGRNWPNYRTHCHRGHSLTEPDSFLVTGYDNRRTCRKCNYLAAAEFRAKRRAALSADTQREEG